MVNRSQTEPAVHRQALSSLMDGELPANEQASALAAWQQDADLRADWHAYHLIGDVLRSEDLATRPAADEAFLQSLRLRLADEPVPLAPAPLAPPEPAIAGNDRQAANGGPALHRAARSRWRRLMAPAAVAAGFVAVVGMLGVSQLMTPTPAGPTLAAVPAGSSDASGMLVRDARLDRYLSAHRSLANSAMAAGAAEHRVQIVYEGR